MQVIAITIITFVISSFLPCLLKSRAANYKNSRNMKHTNSIRQNKELTHKTSNPNNFIRIKTQFDTNTNRFANGISSRSTHGTHSYCKKKKKNNKNYKMSCIWNSNRKYSHFRH